MGLPTAPVRRGSVRVLDEEVAIRSLTRAEAIKVKEMEGDLGAAERHIVACGTDTPPADVEAWYAEVDAAVVDVLVDAITRLSGFGQDAQFRS